MYATYNITSDQWSEAAMLYNLQTEILPVYNGTTNFTETDVQVTVQEGKFIITWERNQVRNQLILNYLFIYLFICRLGSSEFGHHNPLTCLPLSSLIPQRLSTMQGCKPMVVEPALILTILLSSIVTIHVIRILTHLPQW